MDVDLPDHYLERESPYRALDWFAFCVCNCCSLPLALCGEESCSKDEFPHRPVRPFAGTKIAQMDKFGASLLFMSRFLFGLEAKIVELVIYLPIMLINTVFFFSASRPWKLGFDVFSANPYGDHWTRITY